MTNTTYQADKFIKHTTPSSIYIKNTIFLDTSTQRYDTLFVDTKNSGFVEIDTNNRTNIIFYVGKPIGYQASTQSPFYVTDSAKLVLSSDPNKSHLYNTENIDVNTGFPLAFFHDDLDDY